MIRNLTTSLLALALCAGAPITYAHAEPPAAGLAAAPTSGLERIGELFAERPLSSALPVGVDRTGCGQEGHCSYTQCNKPDCAAGSTAVCDCVASEADPCADVHNPWNPFDNDVHGIFNCDCNCKPDKEDEEPVCTVYDPRDPRHCLVGELPGVGNVEV